MHVYACMCVCVNMCGNYPNLTSQNIIIQPTTNISRTPTLTTTSPSSKFSFQRLMTVKIKTNDVTPTLDGDGMYDKDQKKRKTSINDDKCAV